MIPERYSDIMDIRKIYGDLTSVDIEKQKVLWDERGKGYYGEYLVFTSLYQNLTGTCKILMNIEIPSANKNTTEIDLLLIHESGLYVFEMKHYKGTIYGRYEDEKWTQYFRTQPNSHFYSPVRQNEHHCKALQELVPNLPVYSFIVFTNDDAVINIKGLQSTGIIVCRIDELNHYIAQINSTTKVLTEDQIDSIFNKLSIYSPMVKETICEDGEVYPITDYFNKIKDGYAKSLIEAQEKNKKGYNKRKTTIIVAAIIVCAVILVLSFMAVSTARLNTEKAQQMQLNAEQELSEFKKKFTEVDPKNGTNVELKGNFYSIYNVALNESTDLKNTFTFSCSLKINGTKYGIRIDKNTSVIVKMKDGNVYEYAFSKIFGSAYGTYWVGPFNGWSNDFFDIPKISIPAKSVDDIAYIKLTNIAVVGSVSLTDDYLPGTEFELYSAGK